jgi:hypothetical protein
MIRCELSRPPTGFRSYQAPADHVAAVLLPSAETVKGIRAFLDGAGEPQRSLSSPLAGQHRAALCHPQREALPERCDSIIRDVSPISDGRFYANETSRRPRQFTKSRACRVADVTCDECLFVAPTSPICRMSASRQLPSFNAFLTKSAFLSSATEPQTTHEQVPC